MTENVLEPVGVSHQEEELYRLLLRHRGFSIAEVERLSGVPQRRARTLIEALELKGLVSRTTGRSPRYAPTPPEAAFEVLILRRREGLEQVRVAVDALQEEFRRRGEGIAPGDLVEVITGQQAIAQRFMQLELSTAEEVLGIDKPPYSADPHSNPEETDALARGVRFRVIYDRSALEYPGKLAGIRELMASGESARVLNDAPMKLAIFDGHVALVPLALDVPEDTAALLLHSSSLLNALVSFFEKLWAESTPITFGGSSAPTPPDDDLTLEDRQLLLLLMSGLKDHAIGRQLGVSYRTVQRKVRDLMRRLGADTRFQAGCRAVREGWLDP